MVVGLTHTASPELFGIYLVNVTVKGDFCFHGNLCCSLCSAISVEHFVWQRIWSLTVGNN